MDIKGYMYKLLVDLDNEGFIIQYYRAFSTPSCYIKLDYGLSNSIRISDHEGKDIYRYRFNLMLNLDKSYQKDGKYYYCVKDYNKMIHDIKKFRDEQLDKYGFNYYTLMLDNKKDAKNRKGFWKNAKNYNDKF